jgi:hypothetical protein
VLLDSPELEPPELEPSELLSPPLEVESRLVVGFSVVVLSLVVVSSVDGLTVTVTGVVVLLVESSPVEVSEIGGTSSLGQPHSSVSESREGIVVSLA